LFTAGRGSSEHWMDIERILTHDDENGPDNTGEFAETDELEPNASGADDSDEFTETDELEPNASGADDSDEFTETDELEASGSGNTTASADLEELVRYVASKLVHNADEISVDSETRAGTVYVNLRVPEEEMGRVIGREGRTAKAIRTLVSIAGSRHNVHARLDIDG
jgi:predicted RNA-binding protein YlqC (UPF0109 family)